MLRYVLFFASLTCGVANVSADSSILKKGDRLAIVGDSITEQKLYSKFIETYLLACHPELDIHTFQFGWGGERAPGFADRMENDLIPWQPNVVTTCYGMNDGSYREYNDQIGQAYEAGMRRIIDRVKGAGAKVVVGSPGVVDSVTWNRNNPDFDRVYNQNLEQLGRIAERLATENHFPHADVFHTMERAMVAAKKALGDEYAVAGSDGVHPEANGHLLMALAFLKSLGVSGDIGKITIDLNSGKTDASDGHRVVSSVGGRVELESTRYPFCFFGDQRDPNGTVSILPFTTFNDDVNRFVLQVVGLSAAQADVTFGSTTKSFTKDQLSAGINLATEFIDNPFSQPFQHVMDEVGAKQANETIMIKGLITNFRQLRGELETDRELQSTLQALREKLLAADEVACQRAKAAVKPVQYSIVITPRAATTIASNNADFVDLFNGKNLDGWSQRNGTATYRVERDCIVGRTTEGSPNSFLCTTKNYGDFELTFDVKVDSRLNSGVQIRSQSVGDTPEGRVNGPQVEISLDGLAGYIYGEAAGGWMTPDADRKPHTFFRDGEWNHYRVLAVGPQIDTWINDQRVSNLKHEERYQSHPTGFLSLQVHGIGAGEGPYEVRWRNLKLREINNANSNRK